MKVIIDITPEQLETINRHAWMLRKYSWYATGSEVNEAGESNGGLVGRFESEEQAELVAALHGIAQDLMR